MCRQPQSRVSKQGSHFDYLAWNVKQNIVRFLPLQDKVRVKRVSKEFNDASDSLLKRQDRLGIRFRDTTESGSRCLEDCHVIPNSGCIQLKFQSELAQRRQYFKHCLLLISCLMPNIRILKLNNREMCSDDVIIMFSNLECLSAENVFVQQPVSAPTLKHLRLRMSFQVLEPNFANFPSLEVLGLHKLKPVPVCLGKRNKLNLVQRRLERKG